MRNGVRSGMVDQTVKNHRNERTTEIGISILLTLLALTMYHFQKSTIVAWEYKGHWQNLHFVLLFYE